MKETGNVFIFGAIACAIIAVLSIGGYEYRIHTAPLEGQAEIAENNAQRSAFENSSSYIEGKEQALTKEETEYKAAKTDQDRNALRGEILNDASTVDVKQLSPSLQQFLGTVNN